MGESERKINERINNARELADRYFNRVIRRHPANIPLSGVIKLPNGAEDTIAVDAPAGLRQVEGVWVPPEERLDLAFQLGVAVGSASLRGVSIEAATSQGGPATAFPGLVRPGRAHTSEKAGEDTGPQGRTSYEVLEHTDQIPDQATLSPADMTRSEAE